MQTPPEQLFEVLVVRSLAELEVGSVLEVNGKLFWVTFAQLGDFRPPLDVTNDVVAVADALTPDALPGKLTS